MNPVYKNHLSPRERTIRAFEGKDHDRVPRHETYWQDTINKWTTQGLKGGRDEAFDLLKADITYIHGIFWPEPFPGRHEVIEETDNTLAFKDMWGASVKLFKDHQTTPEHIGWECDSSDIWRQKFRPLYEDRSYPVELDIYKEAHAKARSEGKFSCLLGVEPFEIMRKLLGDVNSLMGMAEEPEWIEEVCEVTTRESIRQFDSLLANGIEADALFIFGDMAYNHATMCSPAMYRDLVWPSHKRLCDWAHQHGMKFIYHTDGDVNGIIDLYIEAGFDCLQPLECKANMDLRTLAPTYGKDLLFFGNMDVMKMIPNDLEVIEEEIKAKLEAGKACGRYISHSDHSIPPQVNWSTYQAMVKMLDKYGKY